MEENDETALSLKNIDSKQKEDQDVLSAEDLAWVNSCLIEDPETSETNMDSLKEALLNILDYHSEIFTPSDNSNDIIAPENSPSTIEEGEDTEGHSGNESYSDVLSPLKHPFLPNFNDEMMKIERSDSDSDSDDDMGFRVSELVEPEPEPESELEDIFKVWELDIPVEEDGLVRELKEALSPKMESVDSLVESIADLSIK